jgi:hypothetical protein
MSREQGIRERTQTSELNPVKNLNPEKQVSSVYSEPLTLTPSIQLGLAEQVTSDSQAVK